MITDFSDHDSRNVNPHCIKHLKMYFDCVKYFRFWHKNMVKAALSSTVTHRQDNAILEDS